MSQTNRAASSETKDASKSVNNESTQPTQAELYDDLRRIGELEDEKRRIQSEIDARTQKLQDALRHLDTESLL